jgi:hypothetical protein
MQGSLPQSTLIRSFALLMLICWLPVQQLRTLTAITDPDIWWHTRVGHWILDGHGFPHLGLFSRVGETRPWAAYSWGFETMVAAMDSAFGLRGAPLFAMAMDIAIVVALFVLLRRLSGGFWWAWFLTLAAIWSMSLNWVGVGRPVMLSMLFFVLELGLISLARGANNSRYLYWLPPLFLIWANCHIQFVYGFVPLALLAAVTTLQTLLAKADHLDSQRQLPASLTWSIFGACLVATLVNPYGFGLYRVVLNYAQATFAYSVIQEFHSLSFREDAHYIELLLALMAFFAMGRRKLDPYKLVLMILVSLVSFRSVRDAWFLVIAAVITIACSVRTADALGGEQVALGIGRVRLVAVAVGAAAVLTLAALDARFNDRTILRQFAAGYPWDAVAYIQQHRPAGPLYNNFNWGGFLIATLPDYPVSIDGRTDVYGEALLRQEVDSLNGLNLEKDQSLSEARLILLPATVPLCRVLERSPQYQVAYADRMAMVFVRTQP